MHIFEISEIKQTATVSLGMLGLNEDFVQVNEIMKLKLFCIIIVFHYKPSNNIVPYIFF
jgi:hypothetical protein